MTPEHLMYKKIAIRMFQSTIYAPEYDIDLIIPCSHTFYKLASLAAGIPPIFFIFRQNLGWERENHQDYTAPLPLHPFVVFALFWI